MHTTLTIIFIIFLIAIGNLYRKSKKPFDTYKPYGIVYDEETGRLFYKGNKVFKFYDRITNNISCFYLDENGTAYSARTAHPFQRNGAPFRFKLSKAQQVY